MPPPGADVPLAGPDILRRPTEEIFSAGDSTVRVTVVESREDVVIAHAARRFAATIIGSNP